MGTGTAAPFAAFDHIAITIAAASLTVGRTTVDIANIADIADAATTLMTRHC